MFCYICICTSALGKKQATSASVGPAQHQHPSDHHMCQRVHVLNAYQRRLQRVRTCAVTIGVHDAASTFKLAQGHAIDWGYGQKFSWQNIT